MEPERVVVRAFKGVSLNRWMVGVANSTALITDDAGVASLIEGRSDAYVVGFPKCDIFEHAGTGISDGETPDWSAMRPKFRGEAASAPAPTVKP